MLPGKNTTDTQPSPGEDHPTFLGLIPGARFRCWMHLLGAVKEEAREKNFKLITKVRKPSTESELRRGHFGCGGPNIKTPKGLPKATSDDNNCKPCSFFLPFSYCRADDDHDNGDHFFKATSSTGVEFCSEHNHDLVCLTTSLNSQGGTTSLKRSFEQLDDSELNVIRSYVSGRETVGRVQVACLLFAVGSDL